MGEIVICASVLLPIYPPGWINGCTRQSRYFFKNPIEDIYTYNYCVDHFLAHNGGHIQFVLSRVPHYRLDTTLLSIHLSSFSNLYRFIKFLEFLIYIQRLEMNV